MQLGLFISCRCCLHDQPIAWGLRLKVRESSGLLCIGDSRALCVTHLLWSAGTFWVPCCALCPPLSPFFFFLCHLLAWTTVSVLILTTLPHGEPRNSLSGCTWAPLRSEMIPSLWTGSTDPLLLWKLEFKDRMGYSCTWQRPRVPSDQSEKVCTIRKQQQTDTGSPVWILMDRKAHCISSSPSVCQGVHMGPFSSVVSPFDFKLRKLPYPEIK